MRAPVSVVIPCYRSADTIDRAVESVIHQTLPPEEILLVDDYSDDGGATLAALIRLQQNCGMHATIELIALDKNYGPGGARNAGWNAARQPYIAFLDADDSWHPRKLELQCGWMESHPEVVLTGHQTIRAESGTDPAMPGELRARPIRGIALLTSNRFPTRSVMLRREVGYRFDAEKRYAEDYLLWLRMTLGGGSAWFLEMPLAYSYKADFAAAGLSSNMWRHEAGELGTYRAIYHDGLIPFAYFVGFVLLSLAKFMRRLVLAYFRRLLPQ